MSTLASGKPWKGTTKAINQAIKNGDPKQLSELMGKMLDDPAFFKMLSSQSPDVAKTLAAFRHAPQALINGGRKFAEFSTKLAWKSKPMLKVAKAFPIFLLKQAVKGSECGRLLQGVDTPEKLDQVLASTAQHAKSKVMQKTIQTFEQVETSPDVITLSQEAKEILKKNNPQAYTEVIGAEQQANQAAEKLKSETDSEFPCGDWLRFKKDSIGPILGYTESYTKDTRGSVDKTTPGEHEDLIRLTKGQLELIGQDSNIDAQHPLGSQSPAIKAYFSPIVDEDQIVTPLQNDTEEEIIARLDKVLDAMIKRGELSPEERESRKQKTIKSWRGNLLPAEVIKAETPEPSANESIFKVGKLTTKR